MVELLGRWFHEGGREPRMRTPHKTLEPRMRTPYKTLDPKPWTQDPSWPLMKDGCAGRDYALGAIHSYI